MEDFIKLTSRDNETIYVRKELVISVVELKDYTEINVILGKLSILVKEKPEDVIKMIGD